MAMVRPRRRDQDAGADPLMREAGLVVGRHPRAAPRRPYAPGSPPVSSTAIAEDHIRSRGATPSFQGYGHPPFPARSARRSTTRSCTGSRATGCSPTATSSRSTAARSSTAGTATRRSPSRVGEVPDDVAELMRVTEEALWRGIAAARLGGRVTDISHAVESYVARPQGGYGILEDYTGHGIGSEMHQPPNVPNYGRPGRGPKLVARPRAGRRADGHPRHQGDRRCSTTTGPSSPPTASWPPTSSTRSRSPPTAPGC